jgi:hypothetical protein
VKSRPPLSSPLSLCGCNARFEMGWIRQDARQEEKVPCFWPVGGRPKGAASLLLRMLAQINRTSRRQQAAGRSRAGRSREKTELAPVVFVSWVDMDVDVDVADGWREWRGESLGRLRRWLRADGTVEGMVVLDTCLFGWCLSAVPLLPCQVH